LSPPGVHSEQVFRICVKSRILFGRVAPAISARLTSCLEHDLYPQDQNLTGRGDRPVAAP